MGTRVRRREPRAHWILLLLFSAVLLAELCLNGYVGHIGAAGTGPGAQPRAFPAPRAVTDGGVVQRIAADGTVTSRHLPAKTVALTFDDGPDPTWTPKILAVLARHHAHATFFQVGSHVNQHPDIARGVLDAGHEIGSHTFTHVDAAHTATWRLRTELTLTDNAIAAATGRRSQLLRPPYSSKAAEVTGADYRAYRAAAGYLLVYADRDSEDWRRPGVPAIVANATPKRNAGAVILMHDAGGNRAQTSPPSTSSSPACRRAATASSPCPKRSACPRRPPLRPPSATAARRCASPSSVPPGSPAP